MISKSKFELIEKKYGHFASWAVWAEEGNKPKDNIGDISFFNIKKTPQILDILNPNVILVALNISGPLKISLGNFHAPNSTAQDFKLRYALRNSPYWGGYMTDIIKDFEEKISKNVMSYLKENKQFERDNIQMFEEELFDLGSINPIIIALGGDSYTILNRNLKDKYNIFRISHYSHFISKENYRKEVEALYKSD